MTVLTDNVIQQAIDAAKDVGFGIWFLIAVAQRQLLLYLELWRKEPNSFLTVSIRELSAL